MGLLRIIDTFKAERECKPQQLEGHTHFYACIKDRCIIRRYDRGATFSSDGKIYKLCLLFMYRSKFDEFVINKLDKIKRTYKNFYIKLSKFPILQNLVGDQ